MLLPGSPFLMPIEEFHRGSGVRIMRGQVGMLYSNVGQITIKKAAHIGVDQALWAVLKILVDELRLHIAIASIDTGVHVAHSRHGIGCAVDIDEISELGKPLTPCRLTNPVALHMVEYLHEHGWHKGEGGDFPGLLLGPIHTEWNPSNVFHLNHAHISVARPRAR